MRTWLSRTVDGKYPIEKIACPYAAQAVDLKRPPAGVAHTTQGGWAGSLAVFRTHYAPTFMCGAGRIAQLVPLGMMDAALENHYGGAETNRWARVQIEVVGYSKETLYSFDGPTTDALASLLATCKVYAGIPLTRPYPDELPPKPPLWASEEFKRRHDGKWGKTAGWFGHIEIPENSHWDPGALKWGPLLALARTRLPSTQQRAANIFDHWNPFGGKWWRA